MQQISPRRKPQSKTADREIVQRFAEQGYQLEPEALEIICRYPGSKEDLLRRIINSTDRSVAVIGTSLVSCHLDFAAALGSLVALAADEIHLHLKVHLAHQVGQEDEGAFEDAQQQRVLVAVVQADFSGQALDGERNRLAGD